jgi:hypothetical protein
LEIQRAPNDSGIPDVSGAETIAVAGHRLSTLFDAIAGLDVWHYRMRQIRPNATPSGWTPWVSARPIFVIPPLPPVPPFAPYTLHRDGGARPGGVGSHVVEAIAIPGAMMLPRGGLEILAQLSPSGTNAVKQFLLQIDGSTRFLYDFADTDTETIFVRALVVLDVAANAFRIHVYVDGVLVSVTTPGVDFVADSLIELRLIVGHPSDDLTLDFSQVVYQGQS